MRRRGLWPLLLCIVVLWGCTPKDVSVPTQPASQADIIHPASRECLKEIPFPGESCLGIAPMDGDLLLLTTSSQGPKLSLLSGKGEYPLGNLPYPVMELFHIGDSGISFYDESSREVILLNPDLTEQLRLSVPQDTVGSPILSQDASTLYYGTGSEIRSLDLASGTQEVLLTSIASYQKMDALLVDDTVLQCTLVPEGKNGHILFLDTATGEILHDDTQFPQISVLGNDCYTSHPDGCTQTMVFGPIGQAPQALVPEDPDARGFFLPQSHRALSYTQKGGQLTLHCYDLNTGRCIAYLAAESDYIPISAVQGPGALVYLLGREGDTDRLYLWDLEKSPSTDPKSYVGPYYTAENPDLAGLAQCQDYARQLSKRHGVEILLWKDVLNVTPWDYDITPEHLVPVLMRELNQLDTWLSHYPKGMLKALAADYDGIHICLARKIRGKADTDSLHTANGLQYFNGNEVYIALTAGRDTEYTLYHELFHVMDPFIQVRSAAYDRWEQLNPPGFAYDRDYVKNQQRDGSAYADAFIDTYSMSFPEEDRARIMEYAMNSGNARYFASDTMQAKLRQLAKGIREAFGLQDSSEVYLWEQYLKKPLAISK